MKAISMNEMSKKKKKIEEYESMKNWKQGKYNFEKKRKPKEQEIKRTENPQR